MWSGQDSRVFGEGLVDLLAETAPGTKTFISSRGLGPGSLWDQQLMENLEEANVGIACFTPANVDSRWMHYEAGMISKMPQHRLIPLRFGVTEIQGPLSRYHSVDGTRQDDMRSLVKTLNSARPKSRRLTRAALDRAFDTRWPEFLKAVADVL